MTPTDNTIQQWEYLHIENSSKTTMDTFIEMGKRGWEYSGDAFVDGKRCLIFKRPIINTNEHK